MITGKEKSNQQCLRTMVPVETGEKECTSAACIPPCLSLIHALLQAVLTSKFASGSEQLPITVARAEQLNWDSCYLDQPSWPVQIVKG